MERKCHSIRNKGSWKIGRAGGINFLARIHTTARPIALAYTIWDWPKQTRLTRSGASPEIHAYMYCIADVN